MFLNFLMNFAPPPATHPQNSDFLNIYDFLSDLDNVMPLLAAAGCSWWRSPSGCSWLPLADPRQKIQAIYHLLAANAEGFAPRPVFSNLRKQFEGDIHFDSFFTAHLNTQSIQC